MVFELLFSFVMVLIILSFIGIPWTILINKLINKNNKFGYLFLITPCLGLAVTIWFSSFSTKLGIPSFYCLVFMLLTSFISIIFFRRENTFNKIPEDKTILIVSIFIVFISFTINSFDVFGTGWKQYFLVTNGDTFAYLGHIDQISRGYSEYKSISYFSGIAPIYQHAISTRTGVASFVSVLNNIFDVETHQLFFLVVRLIFPLILLCFLFIFLNLKMRWREIIFSIIILIMSNFGLNSVFQQFLSASIGIVVLWLFFIGLFLVSCNLENIYSWLFSGIILGILGLSSIEAFFVLLPFVAGVLLILGHKIKTGDKFKYLFVFAIGVIIGLLPIVRDSQRILVLQFNSGMGDHPGNWIARAGFIVQFLGFKIYLGEIISNKFIILSILFSSLYLFSIVISFWVYIKNKDKNGLFYLVLFSMNLYYLILESFLYTQKKGYALLKVSDYFSFLILFTILISYIYYFKFLNKRLNVMFYVLCGLILLVYSGVSFWEKIRTENIYSNYVTNSLPLDLIKKDINDFTKDDINKIYAFDASMDTTDLLFYVGRDLHGTLISLHSSYRYKFDSNVFPDYIISVSGTKYSDINRKSDQVLKTGIVLSMRKVDKYIAIDNTSGNWLGAECISVDNCFQWLSENGKLKIYLDELGTYKLHFKVACGPDWNDNQVSYDVAGDSQKITLNCAKINDVSIPIKVNSNVTTVSVVVGGAKKGIRQISVSDLYLE